MEIDARLLTKLFSKHFIYILAIRKMKWSYTPRRMWKGFYDDKHTYGKVLSERIDNFLKIKAGKEN